MKNYSSIGGPLDCICAINKAQNEAFKAPAVVCYGTDEQEAIHLGVCPHGYHGLVLDTYG
jgi:hypothetical protein